MSPFDLFKELTKNNKPDHTKDPLFDKAYNPVMTNRIVSFIEPYTVLAEKMDKHLMNIPKDVQYMFYDLALPKVFTRVDYIKKNSERKNYNEIRKSICKYFEVGSRDCDLILDTLPVEEIERIHAVFESESISQ